jgi:molybdate transport system substrate-binding protein
VRIWLAAVVTVALASQNIPSPQAITVSAAVSLTDALSAIAKDYGGRGRGDVRFNFAASNVLARQIVEGAPVDVYISADEAQMDVVARAGLVHDGSRIDLLGNQLAVVVPSDRPRAWSGIAQIAGPEYRRIAIGDPAAVPAGVYAKQYLEKENLWTQVQPRIVPTANVRAAMAAVEAGAADAAIVYRTDARTALRATVAWVVPVERGPRIVYPAAIVRGTKRLEEARRFLDYLRGPDAERAFTRFGFTVVR